MLGPTPSSRPYLGPSFPVIRDMTARLTPGRSPVAPLDLYKAARAAHTERNPASVPCCLCTLPSRVAAGKARTGPDAMGFFLVDSLIQPGGRLALCEHHVLQAWAVRAWDAAV